MSSSGGTVLDDCYQINFGFESKLPEEVDAATIRSRKKGKEICQPYQTGSCPNGDACPRRHIITHFKTVQQEVCRHWLRGACINGENCCYIHEFNDRLIPECVFYTRFGQCTNPECVFRHVHPDDKIPRCAAYERGFCPHGPDCKLRHVKVEKICPFYLNGFCPKGSECTEGGHPVSRLHDRHTVQQRVREQLIAEKAAVGGEAGFDARHTCFSCFDPGHLPSTCPGIVNGRLFRSMMQVHEPGEKPFFMPDGRSAGQYCFFCGDESHKIRDCPSYARQKAERQGGGGGGGGGYQQQQYQQQYQQYAPSSYGGGGYGGGGPQQHVSSSYGNGAPQPGAFPPVYAAQPSAPPPSYAPPRY